MPKVSRTFTFQAAHRLLNHGGKCRHIHGHSYKATVTIGCTVLDDQGMVVDFGRLKETIGAYIDTNLDHNLILDQDNDPLYELLTRPTAEYEKLTGGRRPYPMVGPPTAENIAALLYRMTKVLLIANQPNPRNLYVAAVTVFETEKCSATCSYA